MQTIQQLNENFLALNHITFEQLDSGINLLKVDGALATATISLYGGQILEWQPKTELTPVLWCSKLLQYKPGKPLRAGVPICWPWFGAHPNETKSPSHGYSRISSWYLSSVSTTGSGATEICMRMHDSEYSTSCLGIAANLAIRISIGEVLSIELTTTNTGTEAITITEALHTYFFISDIAQIRINGLNECDYVDLVDGNSLKTQSDAIEFSEELGRVYLDTTADCLIEDPVLHRTLRITKTGSQSTVVWNPWLKTASTMDDLGPEGWRSMVCVESANALADAVTVAPGEQHTLSVTYSVTNQ